MRGIGSALWKVAGAVSLTALVSMGAVGTASAGTASAVAGVAACDVTTGNQVITWTFTNQTQLPATTLSATASAALLTAGTIASTTVVMNPSASVASLGTSVGQTVASPDAVGTVSISLGWLNTVIDSFQTSTANVVLAGTCVVPPTTTAAATTTTTAAPATTAVAGVSGTLPKSGSDPGPIAALAAILLAVGVVLVRRRPHAA